MGIAGQVTPDEVGPPESHQTVKVPNSRNYSGNRNALQVHSSMNQLKVPKLAV